MDNPPAIWPPGRLQAVLAALALLLAVGCNKVDPALLGHPPQQAPTISTSATSPADVDPMLWRTLVAGLPDSLNVDFDKLTSNSQLDADLAIELRPGVLSRVGLWQPIVSRLPQSYRAAWQEVVDAVGVDPVPRVNAISFSLKYAEGTGRTEKVSIFARTRDGLATDVLRWVGSIDRRRADNSDSTPSAASVAIFESLSEEERKAAQARISAWDSNVQVLTVTPEVTLLFAPDDSWTSASLITPNGIVSVEGQMSSLSAAVEAISRVLRRAEGGTGDANEADDILAKGRFHLPKEDVEVSAELRLETSLRLRAEIRVPEGKVTQVTSRLRDQSGFKKAYQPLHTVLPRAARTLDASTRVSVVGNMIALEASVPTDDIVADLGGVALPMTDRALALGKGFDDAAFSRSAPTTSTRIRTEDDLARAFAPSVPFAFGETSSERHRLIRNWLDGDGSLRTFVEGTARRLGAVVPVRMDECGQANAYYSPRYRSITLCYDLVADLIEKLRPSFRQDALGPAVLGTMLFVLIHEYGHALVHQLELPVTGREEDAVDQLATLKLIETGDAGINYALAAQRWFAASVKLGRSVPNWDEHSPDAVRFYEMSCLIYGSNPNRFASLAGSDWLPANRARRCPAEYEKVKSAWDKLLARSPSPSPRPTQPEPAAPQPQPVPSPSPQPRTTPSENTTLPCQNNAGRWEFTTTVTSALKSTGVGVRGYYRLVLDQVCNITIEKLGFEKTYFTPDRVQRASGRLRQDGSFWVVETAFGRGGGVDYTAELRFDFRAGLTGTWRYTGSSWDSTGFAGTLVGRRQ